MEVINHFIIYELFKGCPTLEPSRKQEERKTEKQLEKISNQGSG
jgi:U3 small nucleolar ribonucleoprotein component